MDDFDLMTWEKQIYELGYIPEGTLGKSATSSLLELDCKDSNMAVLNLLVCKSYSMKYTALELKVTEDECKKELFSFLRKVEEYLSQDAKAIRRRLFLAYRNFFNLKLYDEDEEKIFKSISDDTVRLAYELIVLGYNGSELSTTDNSTIDTPVARVKDLHLIVKDRHEINSMTKPNVMSMMYTKMGIDFLDSKGSDLAALAGQM